MDGIGVTGVVQVLEETRNALARSFCTPIFDDT